MYQSDYCTSCKEGYLLEGNTCVEKEKCEEQEGKFVDKVENKCKDCNKICKNCKD